MVIEDEETTTSTLKEGASLRRANFELASPVHIAAPFATNTPSATEMNWTGGTLQRTEHANKGVVRTQRAYFARARTKLQRSPGTSMAHFRPSYLHENVNRDPRRRILELRSSPRRHTGCLATKRCSENARHAPAKRLRESLQEGQRELHDSVSEQTIENAGSRAGSGE